MGTLTCFELKKMLGGRFFLIALCLLLAVNILLNCGIPNYLLVREAVVKRHRPRVRNAGCLHLLVLYDGEPPDHRGEGGTVQGPLPPNGRG